MYKTPHFFTHAQVLASNLAALYQMTETGSSSQGTLERLALAVATDDFDASLLQLASPA